MSIGQLQRIDVKEAEELDSIPLRLLRDSAHVVAAPLTRIINKSLVQGVVPDDFIVAKVIPVFKKGKPENMDNFRPISVLLAVSKLLERVVHETLHTYVAAHHLLESLLVRFS